MPSSSALPQKSLRASNQAIAMPNGSATTVATTAMRSESSTAVHSSGVRENTSPHGSGWSNVSRRRPQQEGEAMLLEHGLRDTAAQEGQIRRGLRLGIHGRCHRIDDRGM